MIATNIYYFGDKHIEKSSKITLSITLPNTIWNYKFVIINWMHFIFQYNKCHHWEFYTCKLIIKEHMMDKITLEILLCNINNSPI